MDKFEYKVSADEIKELIAEGEYAEAVKIADKIDWRRVRSIMMLCTISDLYKINRRYQESKDVLLMAYEKHPTGRLIIYSLCELAIKMGEYDEASRYYREFVQVAPKDTGRYVLQYRLYEALEVTIEERIAILEEFKKREPKEKWVYELAYLYHRIGLSEKCVEECDEMFIWFGEGRYVIKALELKAFHQPLTGAQQEYYDAYVAGRSRGLAEEEETAEEEPETYPEDYPEEEFLPGDTQVAGRVSRRQPGDAEDGVLAAPTTPLPEVKTVDLGQYNTMNLQMALAESIREVMEEESPGAGEDWAEPDGAGAQKGGASVGTGNVSAEVYGAEPGSVGTGTDNIRAAHSVSAGADALGALMEMDDADVGTDDVGIDGNSVGVSGVGMDMGNVSINARNIGADTDSIRAAHSVGTDELTELAPEAEEEEAPAPSITDALIAPLLEDTGDLPQAAPVATGSLPQPAPVTTGKIPQTAPATTGNLPQAAPVATGKIPQTAPVVTGKIPQAAPVATGKIPQAAPITTGKIPQTATMTKGEMQQAAAEIALEDTLVFDAQKIIAEMTREAERLQRRAMREQAALAASRPTEYDKFLSQEYDGQLRFVVPDAAMVEKQITGQLSIDDVMAEWEQMKKNNEEKRMADVRRHILTQTGSLFASFDEATKNGLLEELERAFMAAIMKESGKNPKIKQVIHPDDLDDLEQRAVRKTETAKQNPKEAGKPEPVAEPVMESVTEPSAEARPATDQLEQRPAHSPSGEAAAKEETAGAEAKAQEQEAAPEEAAKEREFSAEEQALFGKFVHQKKAKRQLIHALDNMSLASCTGNVLLTGEEETSTLTLAKAMIHEMQTLDGNFSGKVAKIDGPTLNKKDVEATFARVDGGALIITKAAKLKPPTVSAIVKALEKDNIGLFTLLLGTKGEIGGLLSQNAGLEGPFNLRVDIEPLDNESLVAYAKQYAEEQEYSIDEFGVLALHTRIAERQTSDHEVSLAEVRELVDEAIRYANKKTPKHFMDILLAKRYDREDMIILREKDFMHY